MTEELAASNDMSESKRANNIKKEMVDVINTLYKTHNLTEVMPLVNLLKILNLRIETKNMKHSDMSLHLDDTFNNYNEDLDLQTKISDLVNRVHIENAMLVGINNATACALKFNEKRQYHNKLRYEQKTSMERRKLFIVILKHVLHESKLCGDTQESSEELKLKEENIESELMNLIKIKCEVCQKVLNGSNINAIDQFCLCQASVSKTRKDKPVSGSLTLSLVGFAGHYDSVDIEKIFKGECIPCHRCSTNNANCECSKSLKKTKEVLKSQFKRMVVVTIDGRFIASSEWSKSRIKGFLQEEIILTQAKEMELQVWESRKTKAKPEDQYLIATCQILLESWTHYHGTKKLTIKMEPAGFMTCELNLSCAIIHQAPCEEQRFNTRDVTKHKIKRRFSMKGKVKGYRLARASEMKVCISTWVNWFRNDIQKLAIANDARLQIHTDDKDLSSIFISVERGVKVQASKEVNSWYGAVKGLILETLWMRGKKVMITPHKEARDPPKAAPEIYINVSKSPFPYTPRLNQINPRPKCTFYHGANMSIFQSQKKKKFPNCSQTFLEESLCNAEIFGGDRTFATLNTAITTPIHRKIAAENVIASTPLSKVYRSPVSTRTAKATQNISWNQQSYRLTKAMVTRSNLELRDAGDYGALARREHSDDEEAKKDLQFVRYKEELNIIMVPQSPCSHDDMDLSPLPCTPNLQTLSMFKIGSGRRSFAVATKLFSCVSHHDLPRANTAHDSFRYLGLHDSLSERRVSTPQEELSQACKEDPEGDAAPDLYEEGLPGPLGDDEVLFEAAPGESDSQEEVPLALDEGQHAPYNDIPARRRSPGQKLQYGDLELVSVLGQGHFGKVLLARYLKEPRRNALCAIKVINKTRANTEVEYDSLISEHSILSRITAANNPFLVGLIGCFQTEKHLIFAIEYACGGDLMGHIHNGAFKEAHACFYSACVVLALEFLHAHDIVYRDMKLDNMLMDAQGYVKLTDFGLSKEHMSWDCTTSTFCGTPEFLAPEILDSKAYTRVVDWWALGVLIYEMILGDTPFPGETDNDIFDSILEGNIDESNLSPEALSIIKRLLQQNPVNRLGSGAYGTKKVKAHIFFRKINWDEMLARTVLPPLIPQLESAVDTQYFERDFTDMLVTIEHDDTTERSEDDPGTEVEIDQTLFANFDTDINWDKFVDVN